MKFSAQLRRCVFSLCLALLAAGVFACALENRLSHYREDPSPTRFITKGARLAEFRLDKVDVPAVVETFAVLTPRWSEQHAIADSEVPTPKLDFLAAVPHLRGPPSLSI